MGRGLRTNLSYPESFGKQMAYVKHLSGHPFEAPALVNKVAPETPGISAVQTVLGMTYRSAQEQICKFSFSPARRLPGTAEEHPGSQQP